MNLGLRRKIQARDKCLVVLRSEMVAEAKVEWIE